MATRPEVASRWTACEIETDAVLRALSGQNERLETARWRTHRRGARIA
jgi:hypothetical protein